MAERKKVLMDELWSRLRQYEVTQKGRTVYVSLILMMQTNKPHMCFLGTMITNIVV